MKNIKLWSIGLLSFSLLGMNVKAEECTNLQCEIDKASDGAIVQLAKDYNESIKITKSLTLDLNGYTLSTTLLDVDGSLILKNSETTGKVLGTGTGNDSNPIVDVAGKFTLESGAIENTYGNGILANGGEIIINGGTVTSKYAPLTGNNTYGSMKFVVNGGILTAQNGPAIYMPGPISLDITGGTLNGGISLRMGKVNISGGTINAITTGIDNPSEYYNYSGNAWLPDALYVFGGTYTTNIEGKTNVLDLNITGGEFNAMNAQGSAVAIYDLGKVAQSASVKISNTAKLNTNSNTRKAYQVLNFNDIGVTNPKEGYNNAELIGKVSSSITGGSFSTMINNNYIAEGYDVKEENGKYLVVKHEEEKPVLKPEVSIPTFDKDQSSNKIVVGIANGKEVKNAIDKEVAKIDLSKYTDVSVNVTIENKQSDDLEIGVEDTITSLLQKEQKDAKISEFFDISINVNDNEENKLISTINELSSQVKLNIILPNNLQKPAEGYTRTYYIVRYHDKKADILNASLLEDGKTLEFESNKFSTYALAYKDVKNEEDVPKTLDENIGYIAFVGIAFVGILAIKRHFKKSN